ncbi:nuclear cap-binding protein subunit 1-like isoform X2 [Dendrobium catenatum]|uniref:nuclear cap-binding protein subunit 1-like isoform X2 n=1 Tax=Dendrobium catenatum TaxID=906689 RepID=UPI0010A045C4|nr:nuclear cap-binding protein subunit 1-like isoform X2 [Dendrobium catenatum]
MPEPMNSWRTLLLRIGDKCTEYGGSVDYREHIDTCYSVLLRELEHSRDDIIELLLQCAEQLPHKIPFYGVLAGLINLENEDFTKEIVANTLTKFQDAIEEGSCDRIRLSMRFLTCLQVPDEFERVMVGVQSYLSIRRHSHDILFSVFDTGGDNALDRKDFLEDLWDRIQVLSHHGWKADSGNAL